MKKRITILALSILLLISFAACTPEADVNDNEINENKQSAIFSNDKNVLNKEEESTNSDSEVQEPNSSVATPDSNNEPATENKVSDEPSTKNQQNNNSGNKKETKISKSEAKSIALKDAGLKEANISRYEIELDYERNNYHYDISFISNNKEYDYEIDADTGKIISVEKPDASSDEVKISKEEAKASALKHAGLNESNISRYQIELEKENGVWKYDISFNSGNFEYEYTINAETGKIIKSEKEIID